MKLYDTVIQIKRPIFADSPENLKNVIHDLMEEIVRNLSQIEIKQCTEICSDEMYQNCKDYIAKLNEENQDYNENFLKFSDWIQQQGQGYHNLLPHLSTVYGKINKSLQN